MKITDNANEDLLPEYDFDYTKAKPNRFAIKSTPVTVTLDADIAEIFKDSLAVNNALRAILSAIPHSQHR
jgi:hypothetical protein